MANPFLAPDAYINQQARTDQALQGLSEVLKQKRFEGDAEKAFGAQGRPQGAPIEEGVPEYTRDQSLLRGMNPDVPVGIASLEQIERQKAIAGNQQAKPSRSSFAGDPDPKAIMKLWAKYPEKAAQISKMVEYKGAETKKVVQGVIMNAWSNPENLEETLVQGIEQVRSMGGTPTYLAQALQMHRKDPARAQRYLQMVGGSLFPESYKAAFGGGDSSIAAIQEMKFLTEGMSPDDIERARRIKLGLDPRASTTAETAAAVEFAKQSANLRAQLGLGPKVAAATVAAQNEAKVLGDEAQTEKSNTKAWSVYDSAMSNLAKSMGNTSTGAFVGFLPSITANQQIAEGAIAVMAPVLKDMFRSAGEGTFTDADQKMLIQMIPTRKDSPKARIEKIKMIDQVVRAKLGTGETSQPVSTSSGQVVPTQQQEEALLFLKANPTHPKAELIRQKLMTQGVL